MAAVEFCGIPLAHRVINASGTFDAIAAHRAFGDALWERPARTDAGWSGFPFAAFVSKTVTVEPRQGNPPPRLYEQAGGMINSIGLPNKGLRGYLAEDLPRLAELPVPLIVNVMGFSREEVVELVGAFSEREAVAALELNVSCPNVKTGMVMGADPAETAALLDAVRSLTDKPVIVKLTPNCTSPADVAAAAEQHGADAVSLVNTLRGMAFHPRRPGEPWLGGGTGGVSGPAIRAVALAQVAEVRARVAIPVVGHGRRPGRAPRACAACRGGRSRRRRHRVLPRSAGRRRRRRRSRGDGGQVPRKEQGLFGRDRRAGGRYSRLTAKKSCKQPDYRQVTSMRLKLNLR